MKKLRSAEHGRCVENNRKPEAAVIDRQAGRNHNTNYPDDQWRASRRIAPNRACSKRTIREMKSTRSPFVLFGQENHIESVAVPVGESLKPGTLPKLTRCCMGVLLLFSVLSGSNGMTDTPLAVREDGGRAPQVVRTFPEINLRGYGRLSGCHWRCLKHGSIFEIRCEDVVKAKLTQAKYLSDLNVLPGVKAFCILGKSGEIHVWDVESQGVIGALRSGTNVYILSAATKQDWIQLVNNDLIGDPSEAISKSETIVPIWLDRWDKFGFRFYYLPWKTPPEGDPATYDFSKEFDFAQKNKGGFVFWANRNTLGTAEGVMSNSWWEWAADWARSKGCSFGINDTAYTFATPNWLADRYRSELTMGMPQYLGDGFTIAGNRGMRAAMGQLAWGDSEVLDADLGSVQPLIRHYVNDPNLTTWLEPHGEVREGGYQLLTDYGPGPDKIFRRYLKKKYGDLSKLNQAWYPADHFAQTWDNIHIPELASFTGWSERALDLSGVWKIQYFEAKKGAPDAWFAESFNDTSWPSLSAPGTDRNFFVEKKPTVFRRIFDVSPEWLAKNKHVWLHLWDLNVAWGEPVALWLNGKKIKEELIQHPVPHYMYSDVSTALRPGKNQLTLSLPSGYIGYRIYLSPDEPKEYPNLGEKMNARWADFIGWRQWSRVATVRRGTEMIREVDPNRQIDFMHPDSLADGIKEITEDFGGNFKNTGYMGGFWSDYLPAQMRSAGQPFSLEPGGPAKTLDAFKKQLGLYHTEGIQGLDYFIHIGNIMWPTAIREYFERTQPLINLIGKYHCPKADIAFLVATQNKLLIGFPWRENLNFVLPSGWNCKSVSEGLLWRGWLRDGVTESDFRRGNAAHYKVIIDTNTSIMTEAMVTQIEDYVKQGGTFVTFVQTGRHTPTVPDSWPISRLTGYKVLSVDKPGKPGSPNQTLSPAPDQPVYVGMQSWMDGKNLTGLRMEKTAEDARDLLIWKDGTVAAGLRKIGRGQIIELGCRLSGSVWLGLPPEALESILIWLNAAQTPGNLVGAKNGKELLMRHYVSNNGLYDIWAIWNQSERENVTASLQLTGANHPATATEVETGRILPLKDGKLENLSFEPLQTRIFLTPKNDINQAATAWFELQRAWWKGTQQISRPIPEMKPRFALPLSSDWAWKPLAETDNAEQLAAPETDDRTWERMPLGIWNLPGKEDIKHAIFRKTFTVPADWKEGTVAVWMSSFWHTTFRDKGRVWLDGKLIADWRTKGILGDSVDGVLLPDSRHTLAVEVEGVGTENGVRGELWLAYVPRPVSSINLAGTWTATRDFLWDTGEISLPGKFSAKGMRRNILIPKKFKDQNVMLATLSDTGLGAIVNGTLRFGGSQKKGGPMDINITPFVHFGEENEIELISRDGRGEAQDIRLNFYDKATYP